MKNQRYIKELAEHFLKIKTRREVIAFLDGILSPQELVDISQRLQIVKQLKRGVSQREIATDLGVGIATVTRGSRELQKGKFKNVN
ncbi:MAG: hypothetical protein A2383_03455 [Candidatus Pacebacteria bacterium RIFOXYB1_FULL_39_46]|nr:MAG: hypothetical protein A2182_03710 [Candidatus Pacebacteria bacterium RIFOXYA1_FULL_38_18]OGJ38474.1 MAG: hypothetical protein A2383_03455 [Candidatus Pacebacteria bacterium RIFOXYB1_FULL_39_46]OGJ40334.1 MAG: hypothetical protein A2411_03595 [Candidatus Pacebacteria bacterium RIFOXYC1_FULL_39_21]OGJ40453.1 MAG: hypothetical protein A2582_02340 [Candidatus Pacebacteria bacterium RIFOXYD1_FULL_39_27]